MMLPKGSQKYVDWERSITVQADVTFNNECEVLEISLYGETRIHGALIFWTS
jgi:hypothetical protein